MENVSNSAGAGTKLLNRREPMTLLHLGNSVDAKKVVEVPMREKDRGLA
jgi:hypothetical protein